MIMTIVYAVMENVMPRMKTGGAQLETACVVAWAAIKMMAPLACAGVWYTRTNYPSLVS